MHVSEVLMKTESKAVASESTSFRQLLKSLPLGALGDLVHFQGGVHGFQQESSLGQGCHLQGSGLGGTNDLQGRCDGPDLRALDVCPGCPGSCVAALHWIER